MSARKIIAGLTEAAETATLASRVARIIQTGQGDGASATRIAYRILDALGHYSFREPIPRPKSRNQGEQE